MPYTTTGYWVTSNLDETTRTYACATEKGLHDLILHLTGKEHGTYALDARGLPLIPGIRIATGLHIYQ